MTIEINDAEMLSLLTQALAARPGATVGQVVEVAIALLHEHDAETDRMLEALPPGELDRMLAEGMASGPLIDGEKAFQARRRDRRDAAAKRSGQVA